MSATAKLHIENALTVIEAERSADVAQQRWNDVLDMIKECVTRANAALEDPGADKPHDGQFCNDPTCTEHRKPTSLEAARYQSYVVLSASISIAREVIADIIKNDVRYGVIPKDPEKIFRAIFGAMEIFRSESEKYMVSVVQAAKEQQNVQNSDAGKSDVRPQGEVDFSSLDRDQGDGSKTS